MTVEPATPPSSPGGVDRRRFLQVGGLTVAAGAVLAACGSNTDTQSPNIPRVGEVPEVTDLPTPVVNDATLFRTLQSVEYCLVGTYDLLLTDYRDLFAEDGDLLDAFERFRADHDAHAGVLGAAIRRLGGDEWRCPNPRVQSAYIDKSLELINGNADASTPIEPSPTPREDLLVMIHALEQLAGASYQQYVPILSEASMRSDAMVAGSEESRHASLLAHYMNPDNIVSPAEVAVASPALETTTTTEAAAGLPTTTPNNTAVGGPEQSADDQTTASDDALGGFSQVYAVPNTFGQLGPIPVSVGAPSASGIKPIINFETPSLNSLIYENLGTCPA